MRTLSDVLVKNYRRGNPGLQRGIADRQDAGNHAELCGLCRCGKRWLHRFDCECCDKNGSHGLRLPGNHCKQFAARRWTSPHLSYTSRQKQGMRSRHGFRIPMVPCKFSRHSCFNGRRWSDGPGEPSGHHFTRRNRGNRLLQGEPTFFRRGMEDYPTREVSWQQRSFPLDKDRQRILERCRFAMRLPCHFAVGPRKTPPRQALPAIRLSQPCSGNANIFNLRVLDVPVRPVYNQGEKSKIRLYRVIPAISILLFKQFLWRIKEKYIIRDFHPLVFHYLLSALLFSAGFALFVVSSGCGSRTATFHPSRLWR